MSTRRDQTSYGHGDECSGDFAGGPDRDEGVAINSEGALNSTSRATSEAALTRYEVPSLILK